MHKDIVSCFQKLVTHPTIPRRFHKCFMLELFYSIYNRILAKGVPTCNDRKGKHMKRHFPYKRAVYIGLIALGVGFYIYNLVPHPQTLQYTIDSLSDAGDGTDPSNIPQTTPPPTPAPATEAPVEVRGTTIALGESKDSIINKLGAPFRIDETEYDFDYYIYNNDYNRLLFVAIKEDMVAGYYTDSVDFNYRGIGSGSDLSTVNKVLDQSFSMSDMIEHKEANYTVQVLMDQLETKKVTGIYVLADHVTMDEYTDTAIKNIELMLYDLTNSIRLRNQRTILSWSSSAALASRKHSLDMATEDYFDHTNLKRESPGDRLRAEGIFVQSSKENIAAGFGTAITTVHKLFNSKTQRNNMLSKQFRYLGVGFAYNPDSTYQTYFTQNLYR